MNKPLIFQLILVTVTILPIYCITVSETNTKKNVTLIPEVIEENLNRTERTRRLIPYMTYYIPSSNQYENIPPNQMYTIMALINQKQHFQDQYNEERPTKPNPPKHEYISYNNYNRYQQQSPSYRPTIVYTTRPQPQSKQPIEQQNINSQYQSTPAPTKVSLNPFSPSNKAPGPFRPMFYEKEEDQEEDEEEEQQPQYHFRPVTLKQQENRPTQRPAYPNYVEQVVKYNSGSNQETKYIVQHPDYQQDQPKYTSHPQSANGNTKYILQNQNVKFITQSPNYEQGEEQEELEENDGAQIKYVNQNDNKKYITQTEQVQQKYIPEQSKYQNQILVPNYITYITPSSTIKPSPQPQYIYRAQIPQKIYEVKPPQRPQSHKTHQYQSNDKYNTNNGYVQPEQLEYVIQKQVPYFVPQQPSVSVAPVTKQQTYTDRYNPVLTTTLAPLLHVNTVAPTYTTYHRNHKYSNSAKPQTQYKSSTPAPIQHLTEITSLKQETKPYFYQSAGPIVVKQMAKYQPIFKPSPPPKIIVTTLKPSKYEPNSLADILKKLQESNHLPHTLTPDNIDNSIKTLVKILNDLKKTQKVVDSPPRNHFQETDGDDDEYYDTDPVKDVDDVQSPGPNTGRPGIDYPALSEIPQTSFNCKDQRYKGFFGDPETNCQVWHYCDLNGGQASFLCPNGTIFSQVALTCDWWFNVKCSSTAQLYVLNERLYKYILPFTPKFPEDYSGPLVDKYLALKFQEMEEEMRKQKGGKSVSDQNEKMVDEDEDEHSDKIENDDEEEVAEEDKIEDHVQPEYTTVTEIVPAPITPKINQQPIIASRTTVETEKVEVIEIKSDGSSGHLIPGKL